MALADGEFEQFEAEFLLQWLESNRECTYSWPANVLYPRLVAALDDGVLDPEEEHDLLHLLMQSLGKPDAPAGLSASYATRLPLTTPEPNIIYSDSSFCFTGKLYSGSRAWAMSQVEQRGGLPATSVSRQLKYLVIGDLGSRDWMQSTHGRKIELAVCYAQECLPISIISEEHWCKSLEQPLE
jgi:NAD-dependent DNA ligase